MVREQSVLGAFRPCGRHHPYGSGGHETRPAVAPMVCMALFWGFCLVVGAADARSDARFPSRRGPYWSRPHLAWQLAPARADSYGNCATIVSRSNASSTAAGSKQPHPGTKSSTQGGGNTLRPSKAGSAIEVATSPANRCPCSGSRSPDRAQSTGRQWRLPGQRTWRQCDRRKLL